MFVGDIRPLDLAQVTVNLTEDDAPAYAQETTYNIGDEVIFGHRVYGCLMDGTSGRQPDKFSSKYQTPQYWQLKGATNAFACLDGVLSSPSKNDAGPIVVGISGFANVAAVGIFDASGSLATAVFRDETGAVVDTQSVVISGYDLSSHYNYMFTPPRGASANHIFRDFPVSSVQVELTIDGSPTSLGEVVIVQNSYNYGRALMGSSVRIASRSVYQDDEFGGARYVHRPARVHANFDLHGARNYIEAIWSQMKALSGKRVVFQADDDRSITTGLGLVRDVSVPIELPNDYLFSLEIEGVQ